MSVKGAKIGQTGKRILDRNLFGIRICWTRDSTGSPADDRAARETSQAEVLHQLHERYQTLTARENGRSWVSSFRDC